MFAGRNAITVFIGDISWMGKFEVHNPQSLIFALKVIYSLFKNM